MVYSLFRNSSQHRVLKGRLNLTTRIITNDKMETSVPGVYAAGDARSNTPQVITAADGAIALPQKSIWQKETFRDQVLKADKPVMVAFWAPQVEESIAAIAELEKIADKLGDSEKLVKMETYRNQRVASRYGIEEIPSLLLFNKGEAVVKITGSMSEETILSHLNSL